MRHFALVVLVGCGRIGFDVPGAGGIAADSLVAYYPMDELSPGSLSGQLVTIDDTGRGHDATCTAGSAKLRNDVASPSSCPVLVQGHVGNALQFDAALSHMLDVAASVDFDLAEAFTVSAWVATADAMSIDGSVVSKGGTLDAEWSMGIATDEHVTFETSMNGLPVVQRSNAAMTMPAWHQVAIRWDGSSKQIFIDGMHAGTIAGQLERSMNHSLTIGAEAGGVSRFTGILDELAIYGRALTADEIARLGGS